MTFPDSLAAQFWTCPRFCKLTCSCAVLGIEGKCTRTQPGTAPVSLLWVAVNARLFGQQWRFPGLELGALLAAASAIMEEQNDPGARVLAGISDRSVFLQSFQRFCELPNTL